MRIVVDNYDTFELVVDALGAADVFYTAVGTDVTGALAVYLTDGSAVTVGGAGNSIGTTVANLVSDYASAILVSSLPLVVV